MEFFTHRVCAFLLPNYPLRGLYQFKCAGAVYEEIRVIKLLRSCQSSLQKERQSFPEAPKRMLCVWADVIQVLSQIPFTVDSHFPVVFTYYTLPHRYGMSLLAHAKLPGVSGAISGLSTLRAVCSPRWCHLDATC